MDKDCIPSLANIQNNTPKVQTLCSENCELSENLGNFPIANGGKSKGKCSHRKFKIWKFIDFLPTKSQENHSNNGNYK